MTRASLLAFAPETPGTARTAIIILPGGGGRILGLQRSLLLARALQQAGMVGLVLKYRTQPLDLTAEQFTAQMKEDPRIPPAPIGQPRMRFEDINAEVNAPSPYRDMQVADLVQAVALVKGRSAELGINPDRIVIVGQSNGSILVSEYLAKQAAAAPVFAAGLLYGAPPHAAAPMHVPIYLAAALDDRLTIDGTIDMFIALEGREHAGRIACLSGWWPWLPRRAIIRRGQLDQRFHELDQRAARQALIIGVARHRAQAAGPAGNDEGGGHQAIARFDAKHPTPSLCDAMPGALPCATGARLPA